MLSRRIVNLDLGKTVVWVEGFAALLLLPPLLLPDPLLLLPLRGRLNVRILFCKIVSFGSGRGAIDSSLELDVPIWIAQRCCVPGLLSRFSSPSFVCSKLEPLLVDSESPDEEKKLAKPLPKTALRILRWGALSARNVCHLCIQRWIISHIVDDRIVGNVIPGGL